MSDPTRWPSLLATPGPILADGAMGTNLFSAGLPPGQPPERWNAEHPERVAAIHRAYVHAGSRILLTNTFGGSRPRLAMDDLGGRVAELNRLGVALAREAAAGAPAPVLVAGDIGPTGQMLAPLGELEPAEAEAAFAEQAAALLEAGADLLWVETMSALEEVEVAVAGIRRVAPAVPVVVTLSFDTKGRTMMGVTPEAAARALLALGVAAMGANCGTGPEELLPAIAAMRQAAPAAVLVAKSNAGLPALLGDQVVYGGSPEAMAAYAIAARDAGARIIGGCCGTGPAHVAAMRAALRR
jgi:5-methyltetrahydrofolate--homocysteine methyltransferase